MWFCWELTCWAAGLALLGLVLVAAAAGTMADRRCQADTRPKCCNEALACITEAKVSLMQSLALGRQSSNLLLDWNQIQSLCKTTAEVYSARFLASQGGPFRM